MKLSTIFATFYDLIKFDETWQRALATKIKNFSSNNHKADVSQLTSIFQSFETTLKLDKKLQKKFFLSIKSLKQNKFL